MSTNSRTRMYREMYKLGCHRHSRGHFAAVLSASWSIEFCGLLRNSLRTCVNRERFSRACINAPACGRQMTNAQIRTIGRTNYGRHIEIERPIEHAGAIPLTYRRTFGANEALGSLGSPLTTPLPALR